MTFQQVLSILKARHWLIWLITIVVGGAVLGVNLWLPKKYTAVASVLVDARVPDPVQGQNLGSGGAAVMMPSYMATQAEVASSTRVIELAVHKLGLEKSEELVRRWKEEAKGIGTIEQYVADLVKSYVEVRPSREGNVISIEFTGTSPLFASEMANALAQSYIDTSAALKADPAKNYAAWFDARTGHLREGLLTAQKKLSSFQEESGIFATDERLDIETARLNDLNAQLTSIQGQKAESGSREREASRAARTSPDVVKSPVIESLSSDLARAEANLDEIGQQFGKLHPKFQEKEAEVQSLRRKLDSEMTRIAESISASHTVNSRREVEIRAALDAQKRRVQELRRQRDEVSILQHEVDVAQRSFDQVAQRLAQTSLEGESQLTNIVLLSPAEPPAHSSRPRILVNVVFGTLAGLTLGVLLVVLVEAASPRIRSLRDLESMIGVGSAIQLPRVAFVRA